MQSFYIMFPAIMFLEKNKMEKINNHNIATEKLALWNAPGSVQLKPCQNKKGQSFVVMLGFFEFAQQTFLFCHSFQGRRAAAAIFGFQNLFKFWVPWG